MATPHDQRDALYQALAERLDGVDCDTYAAILSRWIADNQAEIRELDAEIDDPADIDEHLVNAFELILDGASTCVDHDDAQAAFEAFDELFLGG